MDAACPTAAPAGSSSLISETACAGELPWRDASRYFSLRPAAGGPGVWLFARSGEWPDSDTRDVVVRRWANCDVDLLASDACRSSVMDITAKGDLNSENLAHNAAPAWHNGSLVLIGGRYNRAGHVFEAKNATFLQRGVLLYEAKWEDAVHHAERLPRAWTKRLLLSPKTAVELGCIEEREHFRGTCQFDGHFSLVSGSGSGSDWLLYARANIARGTNNGAGGRHVQMTRAPSPSGPWGGFRLLKFGTWNATDPVRPEVNIYLPAVKRNPVDSRTLLGLFPYYDDVRAFIGLAMSCDGWQFSELEPFVPSSQGNGIRRISDHPVDGWLVRRDHVHFFVHQNVPGIAASGSRLIRYAVPMPALREWTRKAMRAIPSCEQI